MLSFGYLQKHLEDHLFTNLHDLCGTVKGCLASIQPVTVHTVFGLR
jgi:hypothetical protein